MSIIFVVDIDGTICDSLSRINDIDKDHIGEANYWTPDKIKDFLSYENTIKDKVIVGAEKLFDIAKICSASVIFMTGRNEFAKEATRKWLTDVFKAPSEIPLIMRLKSQDGMSTAECKEQLFLQKIYNPDNIFIFFEDEERAIETLSKYGLVLKAPECWEVLR